MGFAISKLRRVLGGSLERHYHSAFGGGGSSSDFLGIPVEIRETILSQLRPRDRQMLRLVCRQLANEIDQLVGPVNSINVSDAQMKKYISFFSKCYIPSVKVIGLCTTLNFYSIVMKPARLQVFTLAPEGIASSEFIANAMKTGVNLVSLNISGKIRGLLNPFCSVQLSKLKSFTLNSNNFHLHVSIVSMHINAFVNVLNGKGFDPNMVMMFWHNQAAILRMIQASKLEEATLFLHTLANISWEETSETELMAEVLAFLGRHRGLKRLKLYHGERLIESRLFEYHTPLSIFNKSYRQSNPQLTRPDSTIHPNDLSSGNVTHFLTSIQEFEFCSRLPTQFEEEDTNSESSFENHVINLLKSLRGLTHLKFSGTKGRALLWSHFEQIISSNSETLVHFEIVGKIQGPINFGVVSQCESLQLIMINNKQRYRHASLSPVIEHFSVTTAMVDKLETLILQNVGLKGGDFKSLYRLRKLKHLGIYRWRCGLGEENLTQEGIKSVLRMVTLQSLLIPWPRVFVSDLDAAVHHLLELEERSIKRQKLSKGFLHPKEARKMGVAQYLCIEEDQDEGTQPLWRRTEWGFRIRDNFSC